MSTKKMANKKISMYARPSTCKFCGDHYKGYELCRCAFRAHAAQMTIAEWACVIPHT